MEEGKKVLGIFLVVLFLIIALGVIVSRVSKEKADIPILGGALEGLLFPDRPTPEPTVVLAKKSGSTDSANTDGTDGNDSEDSDTQDGAKTTNSGTNTSGSNGSSNGSKVTTNEKGGETSASNSNESNTTNGSKGDTSADKITETSSEPVVMGTDESDTGSSSTNLTKGGITDASANTTTETLTKGNNVTADRIPDTGASPVLISLALAGLSGGTLLNRLASKKRN